MKNKNLLRKVAGGGIIAEGSGSYGMVHDFQSNVDFMVNNTAAGIAALDQAGGTITDKSGNETNTYRILDAESNTAPHINANIGSLKAKNMTFIDSSIRNDRVSSSVGVVDVTYKN